MLYCVWRPLADKYYYFSGRSEALKPECSAQQYWYSITKPGKVNRNTPLQTQSLPLSLFDNSFSNPPHILSPIHPVNPILRQIHTSQINKPLIARISFYLFQTCKPWITNHNLQPRRPHQNLRYRTPNRSGEKEVCKTRKMSGYLSFIPRWRDEVDMEEMKVCYG